MGQSQCNICNNNNKDEVSMIQHQKTMQTNNSKSFKSPFSGEEFLKSIKSTDKFDNNFKTIFSKRQAAIYIQSYYRGSQFRRQFTSKIKVRLKVEYVKIIETLRKSLIPEIVISTLNQLPALNIEKCKKLNFGNKFIEQLFFYNKDQSVLLKNSTKDRALKINFLGPCLIIYPSLVSDNNFSKSNAKLSNHKASNKINQTSKTLGVGNFTSPRGNNNVLMSAKTATHFSDLQESETQNHFMDSFITSKGKSFYFGQVNIHNQKNGYGYFISEKGKYYEGFWNKDKFEGYGRIIDSRGIITEGMSYYNNYRILY